MRFVYRNIGSFVIKYRVAIVILWILITILGVTGASKVKTVLRGEGTNAPGSESYIQEALLSKDFDNQYLQNIIYTFTSQKTTFDDPKYIKVLREIKEKIESNPTAGRVLHYEYDHTMISNDALDTFIYVGLNVKNFREAEVAVNQITKMVRTIKIPPEIKMHVVSSPIFASEMGKISGEDGSNAEKRVLPIVFVILILSFGSLIGACLPLIIGVMSYTLTLACLYTVGQFLELTNLCINFTTMVGLGVGIDYSLLIVNRFREELDKGISCDEAICNTIGTAGKSVTFSGFAVCIGLLGLLIPNVPLIHAYSLSGLLVVLITICLSVTLMPALLSLFGTYVNYPQFLTKYIKKLWENKLFWITWARSIMKRPKLYLIVSLIFLLFISSYVFHIKLWNSSLRLMPDRMESKQGFNSLLKVDQNQMYSPIMVTIETRDNSYIWTRKNLTDIHKYITDLLHDYPIAKVVGVINSYTNTDLNNYVTISNYISSFGSIANMELMGLGNDLPFKDFISTDEKKTVFWVTRKIDIDETADWTTIKDLRKWRDKEYKKSNLKILVGGLGAVNVDFSDNLYKRFPLTAAFIILTTFFIMLFSFKSLTLALKAVFLNIISVSASFGWLVLVMQYGVTARLIGIDQTPGALLIITPIILFCVIFGLSMDYEIFLVSRIKEEYDITGDTETAIANGLQKTGGIITNAAVIMIVVFEAFTFAEIVLVKEIGLGLATAIFIDASIIRIILLPAIMKLLGKWCWWSPKFK